MGLGDIQLWSVDGGKMVLAPKTKPLPLSWGVGWGKGKR